MNDPSQHRLWSIPGDGLLARQGGLILLVSIDDHEFTESLLDLLTRTSEGGGDGRALAEAVSAQLERHRSWGGSQAGPALVAFGPAGNGLAITVSGTAFADIGTPHGTDRLVAGQAPMLLKSVVGVPVQTVRARLADSQADSQTDRLSRLDSGTARAGGLSYVSAQPGAPVGPSGTPGQISPVPVTVPQAAAYQETPAASPAAQTPGSSFPADPRPQAGIPTGPFPGESTPPAESPYQQPEVPAVPAGHNPAEPGPSLGALYALGLEEPGAARPKAVPHTERATFDDRPVPGPPAVPSPPVPRPPAVGTRDSAGSAIVLGIYCKNGHFTDPEARSCVVCGTGITGINRIRNRPAPPQPGPRPPLGVLILDDGATVAVDGDYVIGRDPTQDQAVLAGEARPLRVIDAQSMVSRVHAKMHLTGWQVLLTDLGSANGTRVQQRGAKTEQPLMPQIPVAVQHGARILVGSSCLRFERAGS